MAPVLLRRGLHALSCLRLRGDPTRGRRASPSVRGGGESCAFSRGRGPGRGATYADAILVEMALQIGGLFSSASEVGLGWLDATATMLFAVLFGVCGFTLFVGWWGQTPGEMLLGLRIIRTPAGEVGY